MRITLAYFAHQVNQEAHDMAFRIALLVVVGIILAAATWLSLKWNDAAKTATRRNTGRLVADQAMLIKHWNAMEDEKMRPLVQEFFKSLYSSKYHWRFIVPNKAGGKYDPRDEFEYTLLERFKPRGTSDTDKCVERFIDNNIQYYQPFYAEKSCLACHNVLNNPQETPHPELKAISEGDLLGIICVTLPVDSAALNRTADNRSRQQSLSLKSLCGNHPKNTGRMF